MDVHQANQRLVSGPPHPEVAEGILQDVHNGAGNNSNNSDTSQLQTSPLASDSKAAKPPRKRNKPSLSCETCTVKKTKCNRIRPNCFACIKRGSQCHYSQLANLIEESQQSPGRSHRRTSKSNGSNAPRSATSERQHDSGPAERAPSRSSTGSSPLLSIIPFSHPTASNLFKTEHPFR